MEQLVAMVCGFLGDQKDENYMKLVETLSMNDGKMSCSMSVKVDILDAHLVKFKKNTKSYLEEQGEFFYQDILELNAVTKAKSKVSRKYWPFLMLSRRKELENNSCSPKTKMALHSSIDVFLRHIFEIST